MSKRIASAAMVAALTLVAAVPPAAEEVTLYRDTWGVPHIYAETAPAGAYALGWAMNEDRGEDLYRHILIASGGMSEHFGAKHVQQDYVMRLVDNAGVSQQAYDEAPEKFRAIIDAFIAGINAYAEAHPGEVPEYAFEVLPWHTIAVGRAMILNWPLGTLFDEYRDRGEQERPFASNQWVVGPERSADGCAVLLTDPHLGWRDLAVFYEARVQAGDLKMNGFFILPTPLVGLGHNANVGWAMTTGGPDTSDVYEMKVRRRGLILEYEYEGEWHPARMRAIRIPVDGEEKPRVMPAVFTRKGPLLGEPDLERGVAYAGATPYIDDGGSMAQQYAMTMAEDADAFFEALRMNSLMEQNVMWADRQGNIGYARVGRTPIRPAGDYDWSKPVPGNVAATAWKGLHDVRDLVHIMNPASGYMQNCNISPGTMWEGSTLSPDKYPAYAYNTSGTATNPRGERARALLDAETTLTTEDAIAITMDVYDILATRWQQAIAAAFAAHGTTETPAAVLAEDIATWDGQFTRDSTAATAMWRLRIAAATQIDCEAIAAETPLSEADQRRLVELLGETAAELEATYGAMAVPWGETHVAGRSGDFYGYGGADFGSGPIKTETLRDVDASPERGRTGRMIADGGTMAAMLMFFHADGIKSYTCIPWGQDANPDSLHHIDQARELFSQRKMKPTWWTKEALLPNVVSEQTLQMP